MSQLYILGGQQKSNAPEREEWQAYQAGVLLGMDVETGDLSEVVRYVSPPTVCPEDDPSILFKAGTLANGRLYACTQTEVMSFRLPSFERTSYLSHPWFNDVHHVCPRLDDGVLVVSTGLDMVLEVTEAGSVVHEWNVVETDTWERFSRDVDYRRVLTTKPHIAHPNHVVDLDGQLWVTRGQLHDVVCITDPSRSPIQLGGTRTVHDGRVYENRVYFTAVDARVIVVRPNGHVERTIDLQQMVGGRAPLGWCRGVEIVDRDHVIVGLSRLRPTKWKENVTWLKHLLGGSGWGLHPTRIALVDIRRGKICWERPLEPHLNAIFSLHLVR